MEKAYSKGKDVASYKWVKIIQSILLIIFGILMIVFAYVEPLQPAMPYVAGGVLTLYGALTIGFGVIFEKGLLSLENVSGSSLIGLAIAIFVNPSLLSQVIPPFTGVVLLCFGVIFGIEIAITAYQAKKSGIKPLSKFIIYSTVCAITLGLGTTILILQYSQNPELNALIQSSINTIVGVILIIVGGTLIFVYAKNPKYQTKVREVISADKRKKYTVVESRNVEIADVEEKKSKKKITQKKVVADVESGDDDAPSKNELVKK